jgi:hypothetical protein
VAQAPPAPRRRRSASESTFGRDPGM